MAPASFVPFDDYREYPVEEMQRRAAEFYSEIRKRRTVRDFSTRPVPLDVIKDCLRAAGTAPSGANLQPWQFVVVSDGATKKKIRTETELVEREFYLNKAPEAWLDALECLGTNPDKRHLETAPYLIVIFAKSHEVNPDGSIAKYYYPQESVGIAIGFLIAALHHAGLVSLTHTPSPMGFLNTILGRSSNERPVMILAAGYPAENAMVPDISKKPLEQIALFI